MRIAGITDHESSSSVLWAALGSGARPLIRRYLTPKYTIIPIRITKKIVDYLGALLHSHKRMEMHGVVHEGYVPCIRALRPEEERALHRLT